MKKFDLEAARRGAAVCQADGRDVFLVGISIETNTICGYTLPMAHDLWDLDGNGYPDLDSARLMMRDDDYVERLAQGDYKVPDDGFIREPAPEQKHDDQEYPKAEMGFTEVPPAFDGVAIATILAQLFGSTAPTSRLHINIEYDGGALNIDQDKVNEFLKAYGYGIAEVAREPAPNQGTA